MNNVMTADKTAAQVRESLDDIEGVFDRLWPILRSISGAGVRATHDILAELLPLKRIEVPSGQRVFDWTVPKEWVAREAHVTGPDGRRILDVAKNNLALVNYSAPFRGKVSRDELQAHLHSRPDLPDAIPYVTSYYEPRWGFCLPDRERKLLPDGEYNVVVDTDLIDGSLTLSEAVLPGAEPAEVLISSYTCHPSLANNELSGPICAAFLYKRLAAWPNRRLSYRFVFAPETIGAIAYLCIREHVLRSCLVAGYVVTCTGLDTAFTYKRSRRGVSLADRAAVYALTQLGARFVIKDFSPIGSDERQYCSPGFDFAVGSLMQGVYGSYPEYHTSMDNKSLISFGAMQRSIDAYEAICRTLEQSVLFCNRLPNGEPQLGRRGLYPDLGSVDQGRRMAAMLWVLNLSDGGHDLLAIAERSGLPIETLWQAALAAEAEGILRREPTIAN